jgi:uncharacterized protein YjbI with pentapeptide repeats
MKHVTRLAAMWILLVTSISAGADKGPDYSGQDLVRHNFSKKDLANANFENAVLKACSFDGAILTNANFQGADLSNATLANADVTGADFRGAVLSFLQFYSTTANGVNLEKADLSERGGIRDTKFRKANLRNLKAISSVTEVDFTEADLRGANLVGMKFVGGASRFHKAKYDKKTRWPQGFDVEASGAILVEEPEATDEPQSKPRSDKPSKDLEKEFANLDANEDGRLTGKEAKGLEDLDANKDGRITLEEFVAGQKKK